MRYLGLIGTACCPCLAGHCQQKCPIWPQEKHFLFVESFPLRLIFFFFFLAWVRPPEGVFSYIVHAAALKAPLFKKKKKKQKKPLYLSKP